MEIERNRLRTLKSLGIRSGANPRHANWEFGPYGERSKPVDRCEFDSSGNGDEEHTTRTRPQRPLGNQGRSHVRCT